MYVSFVMKYRTLKPVTKPIVLHTVLESPISKWTMRSTNADVNWFINLRSNWESVCLRRCFEREDQMIKLTIQYIPLICWIIFLHWRAWDKTRAESFVDPINWLSVLIMPGWYLLWEYGWPYLIGLFGKDGKWRCCHLTGHDKK